MNHRVSALLASALLLSHTYLLTEVHAQSVPPPMTGQIDGSAATAILPADPAAGAGLVVQQGQTQVLDFSNGSVLNINGNLSNLGTIVAVSTNQDVQTATINAANIYNYSGATITSVLPPSLPGYTGALYTLSLVLNATQNIVNAGTISSANNLTMTAGGSITNALPAGITNITPTFSAVNDVNLTTSALANAGLISSQAGNINIAAAMASNVTSNLAINSIGGTFQALQGVINMGDASLLNSTNMNILGGGFLANQLNLAAGPLGNIDVITENLTATVNADCQNIHLHSQSGSMSIGTINYADDPILTHSEGGNLIIDLAIEDGDITLSSAGGIRAAGPIVSNFGKVDLLSWKDIEIDSISAGQEIVINAGQGVTAKSLVSQKSFVYVNAANSSLAESASVPAVGDVMIGTASAKTSLSLVTSNGLVTAESVSGDNIDIESNSDAQAHLPDSINILANSLWANFVVYNYGSGGLLVDKNITTPFGYDTFTGGEIVFGSEQGTIEIGAVTLTAQNKGGNHSVTIVAPKVILNGTTINARGGSDTNYGGYANIAADELVLNGANLINVDANGSFASGSADIYPFGDGPLLVSGGGSLEMNGDGPQNATLEFFGPSVTVNGPTINMHANGSMYGSNDIEIFEYGPGGGGIILGDGAGKIKASVNSAPGGIAGMINAFSTGNLRVESAGVSAAALGENSTGGFMWLAAGTGPDATGILTINGNLNVSGTGNGAGGSVYLYAPTTIVNDGGTSHVSANGGSSGNGGFISVYTDRPGGDVSIGGTGSSFLLSADGGSAGSSQGDAGAIEVLAGGNLTINGGNALHARVLGDSGAGGNLRLIAGMRGVSQTYDPELGQWVTAYQVADDEMLSVYAGTLAVRGAGSGAGGTIQLLAANVAVKAGASLTADGGITGKGGLIKIESTIGTVNVEAQSILARGGTAEGNGGTISLKSADSLLMSGTNINASARGAGDGGKIAIQSTSDITETAGSSISSSSGASGNGGEVSIKGAGIVQVLDNVTVLGGTTSGDGGNISIENEGSLTEIVGPLQADARGSGNGGKISVKSTNTGSVVSMHDASNGSQLTSRGGIASGSGGSVLIESGGSIAADGVITNVGARGAGDGGTVLLTASGDLSYSQSISANGSDTGNGGAITIKATGDVTLSSPETFVLSANSGQANGLGGVLQIESNKATISGSLLARGYGGLGQIGISSEHDLELIGNTIDASSLNDSKGGRIEIVSNSGNISIFADVKAEGGIVGDGGEISLSSIQGNLFLGSAENQSLLFARGGSQTGQGGTVSLFAQDELMLNVSEISVGSRAGVGDAGSIDVNSALGNITISGNVTASAKSSLGDGGDISLRTKGDYLTVHGNIDFSARVNGNGGSLTTDPNKASNYDGHILGYAVGTDRDGGYWSESTDGDINYKDVQLWSLDGNGGYLKLNAKGSVNVENDINTWGYKNGGYVEITSEKTIHTGSISTYSFGTIQNNQFDAGGLTLKAAGEVSTGRINASSASGRAGSIFVQTNSEHQFVIGGTGNNNGINGDTNISGVVAGPVFVEPSRIEEGTYFYVENSGSGGVKYNRSNALISDTSKTLPPGVVLVAKNGPISIDGKLHTEGLLQSNGGYIALISERLNLNASIEAIAIDVGGTIHIASNEINVFSGADIAATGSQGGFITIGPRDSREVELASRELQVPKISINQGNFDNLIKIKGAGQTIIYANGTHGGGNVDLRSSATVFSAVDGSNYSWIMQASATENGAGGTVRFEPLLWTLTDTRISLMADAAGQHSSGHINVAISSYVDEDKAIVIGNGFEMISLSAFGGRTDTSPPKTGISLSTLADVYLFGNAVNLLAAPESAGNLFELEARGVTIKGDLIAGGGAGKSGGRVSIAAGAGIILDHAIINTRPPGFISGVGNGSVLLDARDGNIEKIGAGLLSADSVTLKSNSTISTNFSSTIGSVSQPIFTQASNLSIQVTKGNAYIHQAGTASVSEDSSINGYIHLKLVPDSLLGPGNLFGSMAATTADIKTSGNIGISESQAFNVVAQSIFFESDGAFVNLKAHSHFEVDPPSFSFSKTSIGGEFANPLGRSRSSGSILIQGQDVDLSIAPMLAQNGPVNISTNKSVHVLAAASASIPSVRSNTKSIGIQAGERIVFEVGSAIISAKGVVTAIAGPTAGTGYIVATDSALIDVNTSKGGNVLFGTAGVTATGSSTNVLSTSGNGGIILDGGSNTAAIELQGGVTIRSVVPIAYSSLAFNGLRYMMAESEAYQVTYDDEFSGEVSGNRLDVQRGSCIIKSLKKMDVRVGNILLHLPKDSVVQVSSAGEARNLSAPKVIAEVDSLRFALCAGEEISDESQIQNGPARRNTKIVGVGDKDYYVSEIALSNALSQDRLLRAIGHSTHQSHVRTFDGVKKIAAALSIVTAGHGPYSTRR